MTQTFVNIYDLSRKKTAVLQNAYQITESQELNQIYHLKFNLPGIDDKQIWCQPFHYVRYGEEKQLYRIVQQDQQAADTGQLSFDCEHVITTLCDTLLFGSYTYGGAGIHTREAIEWLLDQQPVKNWQLDECDFDAEFEYCWEQENLLNALYSIPKPFADPYKWVFDCSSWPWKISLKRIDDTAIPEFYIRAKRNLLSSGVSQNNAEICTRIYPLGYGEGVNQLTIKEVNNGIPYLQAPKSVIDQYGIIDRVLVDRSFESAESLKAYAQSMLDHLSTPSYERRFDVADLYPLTSADIDKAEVGKICRLTEDGTNVYITRTERILDDPGSLQIDLSNKATDVASTIADLADRVRIESVYAQGATQLYQHSKDANATKDKGMILSLYFPKEMRQINKVLLKVELNKFRAYSQTTESGGGSSATSEGGSASGSTSQATGSGGFSATAAGTTDAIWPGDQNWLVNKSYTGSFTTNHSNDYSTYNTGAASGSGSHTHTYYKLFDHYHTGSFSYTIYLAKAEFSHSHKCSVSISGNQSAHTHTFNIGNHTHKVPIPPHSHNITPGIFESSQSASAFSIYVGSTLKQTISATRWEGDITQWLLNDSGTIPRDSWIKVEIRPNNLAYVISSVFVQGFVQSRGGGNY